ncbi:hypothetical protein TNCT_75851 [Trichonephila clavata]|uniref:Uncharacterized protein n=1 Tax=Trichonephila clavata TaxID=2740835 RepID=A0A8X6HK03_TRICU|nr:hypothetical protein TNCT_75851 [Trichonephila clavata]
MRVFRPTIPKVGGEEFEEIRNAPFEKSSTTLSKTSIEWMGGSMDRIQAIRIEALDVELNGMKDAAKDVPRYGRHVLSNSGIM